LFPGLNSLPFLEKRKSSGRGAKWGARGNDSSVEIVLGKESFGHHMASANENLAQLSIEKVQ